MTKRVWLIEDDGPKRSKLREHLLCDFPDANILEAKSARAALVLLRSECPNFALLDMSLPTFDIGPKEAGGRPQGFGGIEFLREMERQDVRFPVIVVTQYEVFESEDERLTLDQLEQRLMDDFPSSFCRLVYFDGVRNAWVSSLRKATDELESQ